MAVFTSGRIEAVRRAGAISIGALLATVLIAGNTLAAAPKQFLAVLHAAQETPPVASTEAPTKGSGSTTAVIISVLAVLLVGGVCVIGILAALLLPAVQSAEVSQSWVCDAL